jgi:D-aspartate ligase
VNALYPCARPLRTPVVSAAPPRPETLLTMAGYYGTLAAARSLGRRGLRVVVADGDALAPACWSRHVARTIDCPDAEAEPAEFLSWLLSFGAREPGRVLCTTSDGTAWLFARHRDTLARYYRVYIPGVEAMYTLLNKWRLYQACVELGIDAPRTWLPGGPDDLGQVQREARFPVVIKPQTQILLSPHQKGRLVPDARSLGGLYRDFTSATAHSPTLREWDPHVAGPIIQSYEMSARDGIYGLSGFIDDSGELFVVRASRKVLQWPARLGVGLCFEDVAVHSSLAADVARLCRHIGYFGPFEVEFVQSDGRYQLIDFNPRFFGQIGFDVSRGLDVPYLVYLAAAGDKRELERTVRDARAWTENAQSIDLEITLRLQSWAGRITRKDCERWRGWLARHRVTDAVMDPDDWGPGLAEATSALVRRAVHPRSTWRFAQEG